MIFKPLPWMSLFALVGLAVLVFLGSWQLNRLTWKTDLLERLAGQIENPAGSFDPQGILQGDAACTDHRFTSVRVAGRLVGAPVYVYAVREGKPAHHIFRALGQADGTALIIDMGYVPYDQHDLAPTRTNDEAQTSFTGIIRCPQAPGFFTPDPDLKNRLWYVADLATMAPVFALDPAPASGFYIQRVASIKDEHNWPRTRNPTNMLSDIPNNHLGYALTWFGLAATLLVIYVGYHVSQGRLGFKK